MFSAVDGFYTDAKDETFSEGVLGGYKGNKSVVEDLEAYVDKSIKMAIYCPNGAVDIYEEVNKRWGDCFSVNISGDRWVDINLQEATKGKAVAWIQQQTVPVRKRRLYSVIILMICPCLSRRIIVLHQNCLTRM